VEGIEKNRVEGEKEGVTGRKGSEWRGRRGGGAEVGKR